jgi:CheY-like chemotaxis protein
MNLNDIAVLVVDDLEDNLDLIEEYLEDEVWSVLRATGGEEAVRLATEHHPDIILLDLMMPRMNGLATLRTIRSSDELKDVGIILQTAYTDKENVVTAQRLGCRHILRKPLQRDRLIDEIRKCLQARPPRKRPVPQSEPDPSNTPPRDLATALHELREKVESRRLLGAVQDPETLAHLQTMAASDSDIGRRLIRVANSPFYAGRQPARTVSQAIVRIGAESARDLLRKASKASRQGLSLEQAVQVIALLEIITGVLPEEAGPREMLALLGQLRQQLEAERNSPQPASAAESSP